MTEPITLLEQISRKLKNKTQRYALAWEWMEKHPEGEYILLTDVLEYLETRITLLKRTEKNDGKRTETSTPGL